MKLLSSSLHQNMTAIAGTTFSIHAQYPLYRASGPSFLAIVEKQFIILVYFSLPAVPDNYILRLTKSVGYVTVAAIAPAVPPSVRFASYFHGWF